MTYMRVLPRDAFNEANLLKCIGKLTLLIEDGMIDNIQYHHDSEAFNIYQNEQDGSLRITNIQFWSIDGEIELCFYCPLNSREPWPLEVIIDHEVYEVFDKDGNFIFSPDPSHFKKDA